MIRRPFRSKSTVSRRKRSLISCAVTRKSLRMRLRRLAAPATRWRCEVAAALHRSVPNLYRLLLEKQLRRKDWLLNRYKYLNFVRKHFANTYFFNLSIKRALTTS